jgi:hypothetical protein
MLDDNENELANLLADEDRVRDVLLAAVDGQLAPPAQTNLADIVQRGKRRARLQVLAASAAAVVLIAAVALGATALAKWGASDQVSTAGPGTALPVTQTLTTTANPTTAPKDYLQAPCIYPGLASGDKSVPLSVEQNNMFMTSLSHFARGSMAPVDPPAVKALTSKGSIESAKSVEIFLNGQPDLVTISATAYAGSATAAAALDRTQRNMPTVCTGTLTERPLGGAPLLNQFTVATPDGKPGTYDYLRVQLYDSFGVRYDVTEVVNATGLVNGLEQKLSPTSELGGAPAVPSSVLPSLNATELAEIAAQVASAG